jgi:ATP-binding cassette subfamily F protein 3
MLNLNKISLRRGTRVLLEEVDLTIQPKQRVGLIGANGCGKSSLFALLLQEFSVDSGELTLSPHLTIAHLAQETPALEKAAIEYVLDGDHELRKIQAELDEAEQKQDGYLIAHCHSQLDMVGGYHARARAGTLLHGLGFSSAEHEKNVAEFSGGWRMRLNLAQTLMCRSDLLLLDEPTNHLDLDALLWLEQWLVKYQGTLLLISHDRDFLDNVVTHIAHVEQKKIHFYTGNYSAFELLRAEKLALQQAFYDKQMRQRQVMQSFVDRFRAKASKARQAQSRLKMLERMTVVASAHVDFPFQFQFKLPKKLPSPLLSLEDVTVTYNQSPVLEKIILSIMPGDRIGILGPNGAGKSTLMKLLAGELIPTEGQYEKNPYLQIGYFAQHQLEQLRKDATPLAHLQKLATTETTQQLRDFLGSFGFTGDQALTPIETFSGGEKSRLVLALIVWQRPNLLLLDEPTNHFDIEMRHALTVALQEFQGALILVSHDRHLLRSTTDSLLLVHNKKVQNFAGDVSDYEAWVIRKDEAGFTAQEPITKVNNPKQQRKMAAQQRELIQPLKQKLRCLEKELAKLQQELAKVSDELAEEDLYVESNKPLLVTKLKQQADCKKRLENTEKDWLEVQAKLEELSS